MKKVLLSVLIVFLSLFILSCGKVAPTLVNETEAREMLHKHLESRYFEPFTIGRMGRRATDSKMWYEADIIPVRYIGTPKENDKYYQAVGTIRINHDKKGNESLGGCGDVYMTVRLNERANEYFLPKLQELFGEQVLPVIQIRTREIINNGNDFKKILKHNKSLGAKFYIEGGIYIFTRIDDLAQKEIYREKIYNFIQYLKSENMFDYVNLAVYILDERSLTDRFNKEIGNKLVDARKTLKTADEFIVYRREQMKKLDKDFEKMDKEEVEKKINYFNKGNLRESGYSNRENRLNKYSTIYHHAIYSIKYLEFETRIKAKRYEYMDLKEVNLLNTMKVMYEEYDAEKLQNNLWDGE